MLLGVVRLGETAFIPGADMVFPEINGAIGCHDSFLSAWKHQCSGFYGRPIDGVALTLTVLLFFTSIGLTVRMKLSPRCLP